MFNLSCLLNSRIPGGLSTEEGKEEGGEKGVAMELCLPAARFRKRNARAPLVALRIHPVAPMKKEAEEMEEEKMELSTSLSLGRLLERESSVTYLLPFRFLPGSEQRHGGKLSE